MIMTRIYLDMTLLLITVWRVSLVEGVELVCPRGEGLAPSSYMTTPLTECRQYYRCQPDGSIFHTACPNGTIFDPSTQVCKGSGTCYELVCAGRVDGEYPDRTHDCKRYYRCGGGLVATVGTCPKGSVHDGTSCRQAHSAACHDGGDTSAAAPVLIKRGDNCAEAKDGYHSAGHDGCREYYLCKGRRVEAKFTCPQDEIFDGRKCSSKNETRCYNLCTGRQDGHLADESTGCREYVRCINGDVESRQLCPAGTRFDGKSCVPQAVPGCPVGGVSCDEFPDGRHPLGCRGFLDCAGGRPRSRLLCPEGLVWDGSEGCRRGSCRPTRPSTRCPRRGRPSFIPDRLDKCRRFYHCSREGLLTEFSCPEGRAFDGHHCIPQDRFSCPPPESDSCEGKPDGYHVDTESGCKTYYYCRGGDKIVYYVCPAGSLYNGEECVEPEKYKCPYPEGPCASLPDGYYPEGEPGRFIHCAGGRRLPSLLCPSCTPETPARGRPPSTAACPDGFYQDVESGCKKYFFCISGVKTVLSCPPGEIYNGDLCVAERSYKCPLFTTENATDVNLIYE